MEAKEKMSTKRWIVTYTKHMKQKRKVYQDGVLELCSSSGRVMLYDDCNKLIDRRFLKKDEIVKSGGTLSFETHIVDVGDPDGNSKPSEESNVKSVIRPESQKEKLCVEWNVLYTTHMTQKAKKYHDGILRVLIYSSHLNLITLLNEDGATLSSKYLKSVACLETGKNCEFPNYHVEICERRASGTGQVPKKESSGCRISNARAFAAPSNLLKDHSKKVTNNCNSKIGSYINSSSATCRDALQILSVLKKPSPEGNLVLCDPFVEQGFTSESSDRCQLDFQVSFEKTGRSALHGLQSANSQKESISAAHLVLDADCEGISSENDLASSIWSSDSVALDTSPTKSSINNTGGHKGLTTKVSEVLGDPMLPGSSQTNKPDKFISDIKFSREVIYDINPIVPLQNSSGDLNGKRHLSASTSSLLKDNLDAKEMSNLHGIDTGISSDSTPDQLCAKVSQTGERHESASLAIPASTVLATSDASKDPVIPSSVELAKVEDFPTFDLGL